MFKDYSKYLSASIKVYLFVLIIRFIMKIVGLDYFGINISFNLIPYKTLYAIYTYMLLYFNTYIMISIVCNNNNKKMAVYILLTYPISFMINYLPKYLPSIAIYYMINFLYLYFLCLLFNKFKNIKEITKRYFVFTILNFIYQCISAITRNASVNNVQNSFIVTLILNFDYIILLLISYNLNFKLGGEKLWNHYQVEEVGLSLLKKMNLKNLLKKLQKNLHNFKKQNKETKIAIIIYLLLSLLWNIFTIAVILFIANINNTLIECTFILTSFWLSKKAFGKAFHLSSMVQCFIVSNLTYYILNRITTPLGISIFVPILLGVGLSYITSKLVKKTYKPLYKGMPEELFEETILKVTDKNSTKYKVCYDFYILKESEISLSFKYNYSIAGIRKIKDRINAKIKELK